MHQWETSVVVVISSQFVRRPSPQGGCMCVRLDLVCACGSARLGRSVCAAARLATSSPCRHLGSQTLLYPAQETTEVVKWQLWGTGRS